MLSYLQTLPWLRRLGQTEDELTHYLKDLRWPENTPKREFQHRRRRPVQEDPTTQSLLQFIRGPPAASQK